MNRCAVWNENSYHNRLFGQAVKKIAPKFAHRWRYAFDVEKKTKNSRKDATKHLFCNLLAYFDMWKEIECRLDVIQAKNDSHV